VKVQAFAADGGCPGVIAGVQISVVVVVGSAVVVVGKS